MTDQPKETQRDSSDSAFAKAGAEHKEAGIMKEMLAFLGHNKKWWLLPIIVVTVLLGLLIMLGGTGLAPFIYTLF